MMLVACSSSLPGSAMQVAGGSGDVASLRTRLEKRTPISVEAVEKSEKMDHAEIAAKIHRAEGRQYRSILSVLYVGEGQYRSIGCGIAS